MQVKPNAPTFFNDLSLFVINALTKTEAAICTLLAFGFATLMLLITNFHMFGLLPAAAAIILLGFSQRGEFSHDYYEPFTPLRKIPYKGDVQFKDNDILKVRLCSALGYVVIFSLILQGYTLLPVEGAPSEVTQGELSFIYYSNLFVTFVSAIMVLWLYQKENIKRLFASIKATVMAVVNGIKRIIWVCALGPLCRARDTLVKRLKANATPATHGD